MSYQLKIPQKHVEALGKIATRKRFFFSKNNIPNHSVFNFKDENHRDFLGMCLEELMGKTSSENLWTAGTIVMGNDRSYERSFYEVLADNGVFVLLICRRFGGENFDHEPLALIELKENYSPNTDHLLGPSHVALELPVNWVDDYKKIKAFHADESWNNIKINPPRVYDFFSEPDRYEEWLKTK